jgi:hypothetical protein
MQAAAPSKQHYPWTTPPGKGLSSGDIEAIVHVWDQRYSVTGLQVTDQLYLLLDDGTVRRGVPVAPEDLDVEASKKNEPQAWGRWRKPWLGGDYQLAWPSAPDTFEPMKRASIAKPAGSNERLNGRWGGMSSAQIGTTLAWSKYSVQFKSDGRFETSRHGAVGGGGTGPGSVQGRVVYDDKGSVFTITGTDSSERALVGGGSSSQRPDTGDRTGTYRLNGYTIELRYDSGRVERWPFVSVGPKGDIWFAGSKLSQQK